MVGEGNFNQILQRWNTLTKENGMKQQPQEKNFQCTAIYQIKLECFKG